MHESKNKHSPLEEVLEEEISEDSNYQSKAKKKNMTEKVKDKRIKTSNIKDSEDHKIHDAENTRLEVIDECAS